MNEIKHKEATASLLKAMEATAARMRDLIVAMPPHDLLGRLGRADHLPNGKLWSEPQLLTTVKIAE